MIKARACALKLPDRKVKRVDDSVAGQVNFTFVDMLGAQVVARACRGAKVKLCQSAHSDAIEFLGKWIASVVGPQPRFDMAEWNAKIEAGQRCAHHRRRVALRENEVWLQVGQFAIES